MISSYCPTVISVGTPDLAEPIDPIPILQVPHHCELVGPVHRLVDGVALEVLHGPLKTLGPRVEAAHVPSIELENRRLVFWTAAGRPLAS